MQNKRILITGGAGLVGSHIADLLVKEGVSEIIVLDNFTRGCRDNLAWTQANGPLVVVEGDIRDRQLLTDIMQGVDIVFHQAAIRITQCAEEPRLALEVLADGTFNVLEAAVKAGVKKVVAASSASTSMLISWEWEVMTAGLLACMRISCCHLLFTPLTLLSHSASSE
jgi:UDP-glucose 4-epimerase